MKSTLKRLGTAAAVTVGLVSAVAFSAVPASAASVASVDCTVTANAPYYSSPYVYAGGTVDCDDWGAAGSVDVIVDAKLTMDGSLVDDDYFAAIDADNVKAYTTLRATNKTGNQTWCNSVVVKERTTGILLGSDYTCESGGFFA
ncbi:hypothetical protein [Nonomuraea sp. NPDC023979]|uniref:hypothetical protein n=1 Tax=Nonomuraea sp. NPDC023979 TaxID=3154796 RepID=UPI0033D7FBE8